MAHTSQDSPSVAVLPPEEGAVLADVVSVGSAGSGSRVDCPNPSGMNVSSAHLNSAVVLFSHSVLRVDVLCNLHPFFAHKLDSGPIRLMTIAHAFNYRVAVLRDGVKSAVQVGRSRKAEGRFLTDPNISWGHQVVVMFHIISTLALEVPTFLQFMDELQGVSNYTVSRGDMYTMIAIDGNLQIGRLLMCMGCPSCLGGFACFGGWTPLFMLRKVVRG